VQTPSFAAFAQRADYSLLDSLHADPQAIRDGEANWAGILGRA
jgi:hypothetical protein